MAGKSSPSHQAVSIQWDAEQLFDALPYLNDYAYKYSRGVLTVVAGCSKYPGAAVLAARAGTRTGAGYTQVVCSPEAVNLVRMSQPSLVVQPWNSWIAATLPNTLGENGEYPTEGHPGAVLVGPGFDTKDKNCKDITLNVLRSILQPLVIDGGALTTLASYEGRILAQSGPVAPPYTGVRYMNRPLIITPHLGEAQRLADGARIQWNGNAPASMAAQLAQAYHAICVLKGSDTYISDGEQTSLMNFGTVALAKAGTGDVLAGIIASLLAQGATPFNAAVLGASLHALAGKIAAQQHSVRSVIAEDLIDAIPAALKELGDR